MDDNVPQEIHTVHWTYSLCRRQEEALVPHPVGKVSSHTAKKASLQVEFRRRVHNYYMKLFTQPCVGQFFLCFLQMEKGICSSVTQQISFIIQISEETLGSGTRPSPPDPGSFRKGLA